MSARSRTRGVLDRHSTVDCAGLQSEADSKKWFAVDEVYPLRDQVVTLATNDLKIGEVADLSGKTVIGYVGARAQLGAELRKALEGSPNYREINNHRAQVRLLLKNRVQAIIADKLLVEWYLDYLAEEPGHWEKVVFHELFPPGRLKIACRGQALAEDLTAGLKEIESSGELAAIRSRYLQ